MQQVFVKFNSAEQVRSFVNVISTIEENFDMGSGRRLVDAKSLLGVFALDLTQPQKLRCNSDDASVMDRLPLIYIRNVWRKMRLFCRKLDKAAV